MVSDGKSVRNSDVVTAGISEDAIKSIDTFEQALALFNETGGVVPIGEVAGDGFAILKEKETLVNIPFLLLDWSEILDPETQRLYASIRLITSDGRKYRISDGSTGIYKQLKEIREHPKKPREKGIAVPKGLVASGYFVAEDKKNDDGSPMIVDADYKGKKSKAYTYYLNTAS